MKKFLRSLFYVSLIVSCSDKKLQNAEAREELIFHSGFEADSRVVAKGENADITGVDHSVKKPNDWVEDFDNNPDIGAFGLQYEGGDSTQRIAHIVPDPVKPSNRVLHFWLQQPGKKNGRIQGTLYGNKGFRELYQSVRLFIPDDINAVKTFPKDVHWLTLAEFWNNITWSQTVPYGFRITLGIGKEGANPNELRFIVDAQDCQLFENGSQKYTTIWADVNRNIPIPVNKWFAMDFYFKEGNENSGRFFVQIQPEGSRKQTVFDIHRITHNTHDPSPDGITDYNPIKLYTSVDLVNHVRAQGKALQIYWDDLAVWKNKRPK